MGSDNSEGGREGHQSSSCMQQGLSFEISRSRCVSSYLKSLLQCEQVEIIISPQKKTNKRLDQ